MRRILFSTGVVLATLPLPMPAFATDQAIEQVATGQSSPTALSPTEDAIERLRMAQDQKRKVAEQPSAPEEPESIFAPRLKNAIYFFAALLAGLSLLKRFKGKSVEQQGEELIELCGRRPLGPRSGLLVVAVEGRRLLLAQNGDEVRLVADLTPDAPTPQQRPFILGEVEMEPRPKVVVG
ncbi:MAG: FliO/MopB family protein [Bdellovibrionales bacterium]|nr:FliO/MopB family protein [Bdellovibrionales bacterium]